MDRPNTLLGVVVLPLAYLRHHIWRTCARLKDVPGPFWARFTNLQRVLWVETGRSHEIYQNIHEHHDFVRIGPNMVSISDPAAVPDVYPMRPGFSKVGLYLPHRRIRSDSSRHANRHLQPSRAPSLAEQTPQRIHHSRAKRPSLPVLSRMDRVKGGAVSRCIRQ
jgi:hypothetical protein